MGRLSSVDDLQSTWFVSRQREKAAADLLMKAPAFPIDARVFQPPFPSARQPDAYGHIEQEREIRGQSLRGLGVQATQDGDGKAPSVSLVGQGGIAEPVADDDRPAPERRADDLRHVLCPRGQHQMRFTPGKDWGGL